MPTLATIQYDGINLMYGKIRSLRQKLVMSEDGVRPLYTHITLSVSCVVNLLATQVDPTRPMVPGQAIEALRRRLLVPRRKLFVWAGTRLVIESPQRYADGREGALDANNGPVPISFDADDIIADGCIFATFTIQTWLAESCLGEPGSPPPLLLSNQFEQTSDINYPEYLETRSTTGRAVFRTDFLEILSRGIPVAGRLLGPADFAGWVMPPIPDGYRRESPSITESSDGTALNWSVRDVQVPDRWGLKPGSPIVECDGSYTIGYETGMVFTNALTTQIQLEVTGYPWATNSNLVSALVVLLETIRNRAGVALSTVNSGLTLRGRQFLTNAQIRVNFRKRHATLSLAQRATGTVARVGGVLASSQLDNLLKYPEDFGSFFGTAPAGGVAVPANPAQQPIPRQRQFGRRTGVAAEANPLVGIMHQLLSDPCTMPPQGRVPPPNLTLNPP